MHIVEPPSVCRLLLDGVGPGAAVRVVPRNIGEGAIVISAPPLGRGSSAGGELPFSLGTEPEALGAGRGFPRRVIRGLRVRCTVHGVTAFSGNIVVALRVVGHARGCATSSIDAGGVVVHRHLVFLNVEAVGKRDGVNRKLVAARVCIRFAFVDRPHLELSPAQEDHAFRIGDLDDSVLGREGPAWRILKRIPGGVCDSGSQRDRVLEVRRQRGSRRERDGGVINRVTSGNRSGGVVLHLEGCAGNRTAGNRLAEGDGDVVTGGNVRGVVRRGITLGGWGGGVRFGSRGETPRLVVAETCPRRVLDLSGKLDAVLGVVAEG